MCQSLDFNKPAILVKEETLTQVLSREFCEIFKNTFFTERLWTTTSKYLKCQLTGRRSIVVLCHCFTILVKL